MAKAKRNAFPPKRQPLVADVEVAGLLGEALLRAYPNVETSDKELCRFARSLTLAGDPKSLQIVRELEQLCTLHVDDPEVADQATTATLLLECSSYYENVGESGPALRVAKLALGIAEQICDVSLQRRSHNLAGALYARAYDFIRACTHMEQAFELANRMQAPLFIMASLANTVAVLEAMGLLYAARDVALRAMFQPRGGNHLEYLHLVNASNGLRISHVIGDLESASMFYNRCNETIVSSAPVVREVTRAYYEAAAATHLSSIGDPKSAIEGLNEALARSRDSSNKRIQALLLCAQAEVRLTLKSKSGIRQSRQDLIALLKETKGLPEHYEDVLKALVKLFAITNAGRRNNSSHSNRRNAATYARLLREHILSVKHRNLFANASCGLANCGEAEILQAPFYTIPEWIGRFVAGEGAPQGPDTLVSSATDVQLQELPGSVAKYDGTVFEFGLRSKHYDTAENWTVAAELAAGGDGRHGFRVGRFVSAIAKELHYSPKQCVMLELASRLHDIGKVAMAFSPDGLEGMRAVSEFSKLSEHALFGEKILGTSCDRVLKVASVIAKTHHECWNGCGFPAGLKGSAIPVEGRICFLADMFISLIRPLQKQHAWPVLAAVQQIECMSGMQIDPDLITPFLQVIRDNFTLEERGVSSVGLGHGRYQRVESQSTLFETLEPVV